MVNEVTPAKLAGLYKEVYAEGIQALIPDVAYLVKQIQFGEAERVGNYYHQPVILTRESGITYAAVDAGAYVLAPAIPMVMKDAKLQGCQTTLRTQIGLDTVARSIGSKAAFKKATLPIFEANLESHTKRLEMSLLYGMSSRGIGVAESSSNVDTTHTTVTFTAASWSVGIWGGEEGSKVVAYDTNVGRLGTDGSADSIFTVTAVDPDNRAVTFSGVATSGIGVLDTAIASYTVTFFWYGTTGLGTSDSGSGIASGAWSSSNCLEMAGVDAIVTNTGTMFNISASTTSGYSLWRGSSYSAASGQLTMSKLMSAVNKAVGRGGLKEKVVCLVSIDTWPNLMVDQAALRKYDDSYSSSKAENGFEGLKFWGANGEIEIVPHACVKGGEAFVLPLKRFCRIGATEITFNTPGRNDEIFLQLPSNNGFEIRSYADQALLCRTPAKCVKITNIVNV